MKSLKFITSLSLALLMILPACKKFDLNTDDLDVTLYLDIIKTNIVINFVDAKDLETGNSGKTIDAEVVISGPFAEFVTDPLGYKSDVYQAANGTIALALDPYHAKPTEAAPVNFVLTITADGYLEKIYPIRLTDEGDYEFTIPLINMGNPSE